MRQIAETLCDRDDHDGVPSVNHRNTYLSSIQKEKKTRFEMKNYTVGASVVMSSRSTMSLQGFT